VCASDWKVSRRVAGTITNELPAFASTLVQPGLSYLDDPKRRTKSKDGPSFFIFRAPVTGSPGHRGGPIFRGGATQRRGKEPGSARFAREGVREAEAQGGGSMQIRRHLHSPFTSSGGRCKQTAPFIIHPSSLKVRTSPLSFAEPNHSSLRSLPAWNHPPTAQWTTSTGSQSLCAGTAAAVRLPLPPLFSPCRRSPLRISPSACLTFVLRVETDV
jgi:hypothetical protein